MRETQDEIKAIQTRIRAIRANQDGSKPQSIPSMEELTPRRIPPSRTSTTATLPPRISPSTPAEPASIQHSMTSDGTSDVDGASRRSTPSPSRRSPGQAPVLPDTDWPAHRGNPTSPRQSTVKAPVLPDEDLLALVRPAKSERPAIKVPPLPRDEPPSPLPPDSRLTELHPPPSVLLVDDILAAAGLNQRPAAPSPSTGVKPLQPSAPSRLGERPSTERMGDEMLRQLESRAEHINQLAATQEAALREFKSLAQRAERDLKAVQLGQNPIAEADVTLCAYEGAIVPWVEKDETGAFVLKTRSVDLFQAEREASRVAQELRDRSRFAQPSTSSPAKTSPAKKGAIVRQSALRQPTRPSRRGSGTPFWKTWLGYGAMLLKPFNPSSRRVATPVSRSTLAAEPALPSLQEGAFVLMGAVIARMAIDILLVSYPGLWFPIIGAIVAPAAFAVYRTTRSPQGGFVWGFRLFLTMVGLLLGGRL